MSGRTLPFCMWVCLCVPVLSAGIACAPQHRDFGQAGPIIDEFFKRAEDAEGYVLLLDGPRWVEPDDGFDAMLIRGQIAWAVRNDTVSCRDKEDPGEMLCMDTCWIFLYGERDSLIISFGMYGFTVGSRRTHFFTNAALAKTLRELFESEGLMTGFRGRCLDYYLKVAAGGKDIPDAPPPPQFTQEEQEEMEEEDARQRQGLSYTMKEAIPYDKTPSEAEVLAETETFLKAGGNINEVADKGMGNTRLHQAVERGRWAVVKLLLIRGADPNVANGWGQTPLHMATACGKEQIASLLLIGGADPDKKTNMGETPLHLASATGLSLVRLLVAAGADANARDDHVSETPLIRGARYGRLRIARFLCENGADINARDKYGATALYYASRHDDPTIANFLIAKGAVVDIFAAASLGMTDRIRILLKDNPKLLHSVFNDGDTALHVAAGSGRDAVVDLLLSKGVDVNAGNKYGQTPLFDAVAASGKSTVKMLIAKGANINVRDKGGQTVVFISREDMTGILVSAGADVNAKSNIGETALHQSASRGSVGKVKALIAAGADVNAKTREGRTALHMTWDCEVIAILISKGADVNAKDKDGLTPLDVAIEKDWKKVADLLRKHGAKSGK